MNSGPLKICLLSYRSNPHSGGQGVYLKNLSRSLTDLGHDVTVVSGPPGPQLDGDIPVRRIPCLDLYNPEALFRVPSLPELSRPLNLIEWLGVSTTGFPEPFTFGIRAYRFLAHHNNGYDIVHDNQSLSYGLWAIARKIPTVATVHHPITVDRDIAVRSVTALWEKFKHLRWHSFIRMQKMVARTLNRIITVSENARRDISRDFVIPEDRFRVVSNGIDIDRFHPIPEIPREKNRIIATNSSDTPLKGLHYLVQAVARISVRRPIQLHIVGELKEGGSIDRLIRSLGIGRAIRFTGRIHHSEFVRQYAKASVAVVPSVYEGFGLPVGEAMACGVPVISTTGGALPEVVGKAGILVPPADPDALAEAITSILDHPERAEALGRAGRDRVKHRFTWKRAAQHTVDVYREVICDHHRIQTAKSYPG